MLRNLLAIEYIGNRHWPCQVADKTEIGANDLPELSPVQQARQQLIYKYGVALVRGRRTTNRLEARETGKLTFLQSTELRTIEEKREVARIKEIVRNIERRQAAMLAE